MDAHLSQSWSAASLGRTTRITHSVGQNHNKSMQTTAPNTEPETVQNPADSPTELGACACSGDELPLTALDREILKLAAMPGPCIEARALILAAGAVQAGKATLEQVIAMLSEDQMPSINLPSAEGRMMGRELARLTGPCAGSCPSCAYIGGTIPNQSPSTVAHALECTITGDVFDCHHDGKPCRGWIQSRQSQNR